MKNCSNGSGPPTKIAAMPIYGKNPLKIFSRTKKLGTLKLDIQHHGQDLRNLFKFDLTSESSDWLSFAFTRTWKKYWKDNFLRLLAADLSYLAWILCKPRTWKFINVKVNGWPLTFVSRSHEFTFSNNFSEAPRPIVIYFIFSLLGSGQWNFVQLVSVC